MMKSGTTPGILEEEHLHYEGGGGWVMMKRYPAGKK